MEVDSDLSMCNLELKGSGFDQNIMVMSQEALQTPSRTTSLEDIYESQPYITTQDQTEIGMTPI